MNFKVRIIEEVDAALPRLLEKKVHVLAVTGDHSTPVVMRLHSWHPVPVMIHSAICGFDGKNRFTEKEATGGSLGIFPAKYLMPLLLANARRLDNTGLSGPGIGLISFVLCQRGELFSQSGTCSRGRT